MFSQPCPKVSVRLSAVLISRCPGCHPPTADPPLGESCFPGSPHCMERCFPGSGVLWSLVIPSPNTSPCKGSAVEPCWAWEMSPHSPAGSVQEDRNKARFLTTQPLHMRVQRTAQGSVESRQGTRVSALWILMTRVHHRHTLGLSLSDSMPCVRYSQAYKTSAPSSETPGHQRPLSYLQVRNGDGS